MKLTKQQKYVCDMGDCRSRADFCMMLDRRGIACHINICNNCLKKLHKNISEAIKTVPKEINVTNNKKEDNNE